MQSLAASFCAQGSRNEQASKSLYALSKVFMTKTQVWWFALKTRKDVCNYQYCKYHGTPGITTKYHVLRLSTLCCFCGTYNLCYFAYICLILHIFHKIVKWHIWISIWQPCSAATRSDLYLQWRFTLWALGKTYGRNPER